MVIRRLPHRQGVRPLRARSARAWAASLVGVLLASTAWAGPSTGLQDWLAAYGEPSRSVEVSRAARTSGEPLLVYWLQVRAAPLGVGPELPGTLVANFAGPSGAESVGSFTFLAVASPAEADALEAALRARGALRDAHTVDRDGGTYRDMTVEIDGLTGTIGRRLSSGSAGAMADGRPAPTLWISVSHPSR